MCLVHQIIKWVVLLNVSFPCIPLQSLVSSDLYEFYIFNLYLEQILVDEDHVETRLRLHRTLATPLLPLPVYTENQTVLEERTFTVRLGDVPTDVSLTAVHLNGQEFTVPFTNTSSRTITKVPHPNNTHCYTLKVPFDDPVVIQQVKGLNNLSSCTFRCRAGLYMEISSCLAQPVCIVS